MDNGFAVSALFQRKTGDGYVDGTWTDAYSYFITASKTFGIMYLISHYLALQHMVGVMVITFMMKLLGRATVITRLDMVLTTTVK